MERENEKRKSIMSWQVVRREEKNRKAKDFMQIVLNDGAHMMILTKSAMLATWMASWTTSARVLPFLLSNIALSMMMAVSIYLVASRTSLLYLPAPFASWWSTKPVKCCCCRPLALLLYSNAALFAQPLFCFVFASKITWGCFYIEK